MRTALTFIILAVAGCGQTTTSSSPDGGVDLAAARSDLATSPDLAPPPRDFAGVHFCENTRVQGTCAELYFAAVAQCWMPTGTCIGQAMGMTGGTTCWQNGARFVNTMVNTVPHGEWKQGAVTCMSGDAVLGMMDVVFTIHTTDGTLALDQATGAVTCPDNSKATIGADFGGCMALKDLINVPMTNCTMGTCP